MYKGKSAKSYVVTVMEGVTKSLDTMISEEIDKVLNKDDKNVIDMKIYPEQNGAKIIFIFEN